MHRVKIDALVLRNLGAILNLCHYSSCCRPHRHVYRVHCFTLSFSMLYLRLAKSYSKSLLSAKL